MSLRLCCLLAVLAGSVGGIACRFDEAGLPAGGADAAIGDGHRADAGDLDLLDAPSADATPPCLDVDHDGYLAQGIPDADCEGPLDCDDLDEDAHPGQTEWFTEPRVSGGFDYDCDGVESPGLDTTGGSSCYWDWFTCRGDGWVDGVPGCGVQGIWHTCHESNWDCVEESSQLQVMSCR